MARPVAKVAAAPSTCTAMPSANTRLCAATIRLLRHRGRCMPRGQETQLTGDLYFQVIPQPGSQPEQHADSGEKKIQRADTIDEMAEECRPQQQLAPDHGQPIHAWTQRIHLESRVLQ